MQNMRQAPQSTYNHRAAQQRAHLMREVVEVLVFIGVSVPHHQLHHQGVPDSVQRRNESATGGESVGAGE